MSPSNIAHRAGPLKQQNKKHKTGKHASKGAIDDANKGRVSVKVSTKKGGKRGLESRQERKHKLSQARDKKKADILAQKRAIGGSDFPPVLTAVVSLQNQNENAAAELVKALSGCSEDVTVTESATCTHVAFPRFK